MYPPTLTDQTSDQLGDLEPSTWEAQAFLGKILHIPASRHAVIRGTVKYPVAPNRPPPEVVLLPKECKKTWTQRRRDRPREPVSMGRSP